MSPASYCSVCVVLELVGKGVHLSLSLPADKGVQVNHNLLIFRCFYRIFKLDHVELPLKANVRPPQMKKDG